MKEFSLNQPYTTQSLFMICTLLSISLMMFWAKRLDSVESGCWNAEFLEEKEAMVEADWIPFRKEISWSVSCEFEGGDAVGFLQQKVGNGLIACAFLTTSFVESKHAL